MNESKEEIYRHLAEKFHYTPEQISEMHPYAQLALISGPKEMTFSTHEEYLAYMAKRGM